MSDEVKTQVGIIGAGPAGLLLAHLLKRDGIDSIILEHRSRDYVLSRIRAGVLEHNTVEMMKDLGVAQRLKKEGIEHHGVYLSFYGHRIRVPFNLAGNRKITIYGQQEVVKDLIDAWIEKGGQIHFEAGATSLESINSDQPKIIYQHQGKKKTIQCDYVAGCDGFHGISRKFLPEDTYNIHTHEYPFGWLGILAKVPPSTDELIYAYHQNGFALHSYRSPILSRLYLQVDREDHIDNWSDTRIWDELALRLHTEGWVLKTGPIIEKGITPMRSFMIDNMQYGNLFIAGDAAHIVPPTGAKGMNLAVADVKILARAFIEKYHNGEEKLLKGYSKKALGRVWRAQEFSNFMTQLLHKRHEEGSFEQQLQKSKFDYIANSKIAAAWVAENYVGLEEI